MWQKILDFEKQTTISSTFFWRVHSDGTSNLDAHLTICPQILQSLLF